MNNILEYLDVLYPNPQCELSYKKDYELLLAVMLSAQTTDKKVNQVTSILFNKYPSIKSLKEAPLEDIENIIKPIGTYKRKSEYLKKITTILDNDGYDYIPNNRNYIESLPGIGHKSANVFLSNIYNEPAIAVDTHVTRVSKRLNLVKPQDDVSKIEQKLMKLVPKDKWSRTHHQLVLFGRYQCKSINPLCTNCKLKDICQYKKNNQKNF